MFILMRQQFISLSLAYKFMTTNDKKREPFGSLFLFAQVSNGEKITSENLACILDIFF